MDAKRATPYSVWVRKHFAPNSEPYDIIDTELRSLVTRRKDQEITVTDIEKVIANLERRIGGDGTLESHNPFSEED